MSEDYSINNRGSIYLENLLAFLVWLLLLSTVIPSLLQIVLNRQDLYIDHIAKDLLTRQFIHLIYDEPIESSIEMEGLPLFTFTLSEATNGRQEICIQYENRKGIEKHACRSIEKERTGLHIIGNAAELGGVFPNYLISRKYSSLT